LFGALAGVLGAWISLLGPRVPTGPVMVLAATGLFVLSLLAAPERGLLAGAARTIRSRRRIRRENALKSIYVLEEQRAAAPAAPLTGEGEGEGEGAGVTARAVAELRRAEPAAIRRDLERLRRRGLVERRAAPAAARPAG